MTHVKEKPTVEETSASSVAQIVPNGDHTSNNIVEKCSSLAGGQDKSIYISSDRTGLTGSSDQSDRSETRKSVVQKIGPSRPLRSFWINTRRCLNKDKAINWKANKEGILHHQDQEIINGHRIGLHHLFRRCMCHGTRVQVYPIIIHGFGILLGCHIMTINLILMPYQEAMI